MGLNHLTESFDDEEWGALKEVKGEDRTWREAILEEFGVDDV